MPHVLHVGVIGASADSGWARESHVPAVKALSGFSLGAVVTRSQVKANAAAAAFGARVGYASPEALFGDPAIDIVTIAVKVPDHHALVLGALQAGKHVYCEWPLSPTLAEAQELAAAARTANVRVAIGLQARVNPAARRARQLIADGSIGRVLGARCYSTSQAWGAEIEAGMAFAEKPDAGVNLVMVQGVHTVDLAISLLGDLRDVAALAARQYPQVTVSGEARTLRRATFDHLITQSNLAAGGTLVTETVGGRPKGATPFRLEVTGERGELALDGGAPRGFQSGRVTLTLNGEAQPVDEGEVTGLNDTGVNVAGIYAMLRDDIVCGTRTAPDFDHAVRLTKLFDDLLTSSAEGRRLDVKDWPSEARVGAPVREAALARPQASLRFAPCPGPQRIDFIFVQAPAGQHARRSAALVSSAEPGRNARPATRRA